MIIGEIFILYWIIILFIYVDLCRLSHSRTTSTTSPSELPYFIPRSNVKRRDTLVPEVIQESSLGNKHRNEMQTNSFFQWIHISFFMFWRSEMFSLPWEVLSQNWTLPYFLGNVAFWWKAMDFKTALCDLHPDVLIIHCHPSNYLGVIKNPQDLNSYCLYFDV